MYVLGGFLFQAILGSEAWLGWVFLFWEYLFLLEWAWLAPVALILALLRRKKAATGLIAGGAVVAVVHGLVLIAVLSYGVH